MAAAADDTALAAEIGRLKKEKDAIILAHNYEPGPVQDIADLVGDSLELARAATRMEGGTIVFCGVDFMAETAAILSPEKKVLLPAPGAYCPMAEMVTAEDLRRKRSQYPDAAVVCYVNSGAGVKAESDICCTSANAVEVVRSLDEDRVIFIPDRNLGRYVARFTDKEIVQGDGYCTVHDRITARDVRSARDAHPGAVVIVHPECRPDVIDAADFVASTSGIIRQVCGSQDQEFVIGTETGILHRLKKECPNKTCRPLSESMVCENMKKISLSMVRDTLAAGSPEIIVPERTAVQARRAIERMLAVK